MRLCRYDDNKLGLVQGTDVLDVSKAIDAIPEQRWPFTAGDPLIANLDKVMAEVKKLAPTASKKPMASVKLHSPVANPTKLVCAPANYMLHVNEAKADQGISFGRETKTIDHYGLFLKSNSALVGPSEGVATRFPDRRHDHEIELVAVIGKPCDNVSRERALDVVAGYAIGLDMTVRGTEDRSLRKSIDTYAVLGPYLVTADEIQDPDKLNMLITVNGEKRQNANTDKMIFSTRRLIEYASRFYRLLPGDLIYTGTPEGVGPVKPGDTMHCEIEGLGAMDVKVRAA
jgi:2-keto-4-pentenoate hydratase/2-oxohepta-3-ene-1,7-dioic acid hydratase in catechol pathway